MTDDLKRRLDALAHRSPEGMKDLGAVLQGGGRIKGRRMLMSGVASVLVLALGGAGAWALLSGPRNSAPTILRPPERDRIAAVDPNHPCGALDEEEMSAAVGFEISGGGETLSRELGDGERIPLCSYFMEGPGRALTVYVETDVTPEEFQVEMQEDPPNTQILEGIGDDAFIFARTDVSVRVQNVVVSAGVQNYDSSLVEHRFAERLAAYIAQQLRSLLKPDVAPTPSQTAKNHYGCDYPDLAVTALPWGNEAVGPGPARSRHYTNLVWRPRTKHRPGDPYLRISRTDIESGGSSGQPAPPLPDGSPGYLYRGEGPDTWAIQWDDVGDDGCHTEMQLVNPETPSSTVREMIIRVAESLTVVPRNDG